VTLILDHPREPPEGHYYPDPSAYTVRAKSLRELLNAISSYRTQNALPAGNVTQEVEDFYRVQFPWLVSKVGVNPVVREDPIARWLNRIWRAPIKDWAESEKVEGRMATCLACPHYAPDHPFDRDSKRRLYILGGGRFSETGACKVHHWAVGLAMLDEKPEVSVAVEGCWAVTA